MIVDEKVAELLPVGIHFGLDEQVYHRDPGIGSTDIRKLARNPADYWYESWMNPNRPAEGKSSRGRSRGTALHKLVYEGRDMFDSMFMRGPDQDGMSQGEKTTSTRAANAEAAKRGMECLKADDYDRVLIAAAMITKNPALATVFTGGMSEVSVIYEMDGVRRKARFDYLKIRGIGDLKTCANQFDMPFPEACRSAISSYRYHEQATWYLDARALLPQLVADGAVYGDHDPEWLKKVAAQQRWGWQFVFFQTEGAPITWSAILSPQNAAIVDAGRAANRAGIENFKRYMKEFGPNDIWLLIEQPEELMIEDMPGWFAR